MAKEQEVGTSTTRVMNDLLEMARVICAHTKNAQGKQIKLSDFIDQLLREPIIRRYDDVMKQIVRQQQKQKP